MGCAQELDQLPQLQGCPADTELFLVMGAMGGVGAGQYALRSWAYLKNCIVGTVIPPYVGVVDRGNPTDPVSGTSTFQSNSLIGLGSSNNFSIQIVYSEVLRSSFGDNQSFTYNSTTGTIVLNNGELFYTGATLWVDRNQ